ncbi:hypothetical protein AALA61_01680 [Oscillospiraceae bacterium 42-9]
MGPAGASLPVPLVMRQKLPIGFLLREKKKCSTCFGFGQIYGLKDLPQNLGVEISVEIL